MLQAHDSLGKPQQVVLGCRFELSCAARCGPVDVFLEEVHCPLVMGGKEDLRFSSATRALLLNDSPSCLPLVPIGVKSAPVEAAGGDDTAGCLATAAHLSE